MQATMEGHLNILNFIYEKYPDSLKSKTHPGITLAQIAEAFSRVDILNFIHDKDLDTSN